MLTVRAVVATVAALLLDGFLLWPVTVDTCKGPPGTSCDAQVSLAGLRLPPGPVGTEIAAASLVVILFAGLVLIAVSRRGPHARTRAD